MIVPAMCGGDTALCQITLTTCVVWFSALSFLQCCDAVGWKRKDIWSVKNLLQLLQKFLFWGPA